MLDQIAAVVARARLRAGRSVAELAAQAGVTTERLASFEARTAGITTTELAALAGALELDPAALLTGHELARPVPSVFLRHVQHQDFDDRDSSLLDDALEQGRALAHLSDLVGRQPLALQAGVFAVRETAADRPDAPAQDGYACAREVRHWIGNDEPLPEQTALLERRFGIAVVVRRFHASRITAASIRAGRAAAVALNARDPMRAANPLLARVNLAHVLCHLLFDPSEGGVHVVIDEALDRKADAAKKRARAFAAELLLPTEGLRQMFGPPLELNDDRRALEMVARARSHYGTPHEIAANHLCNRRFVDSRLRDWLEAAKTEYTNAASLTALPLPGAPSALVAELTETAHRSGAVTDGEARATLCLDRLAPLPWDRVEL